MKVLSMDLRSQLCLKCDSIIAKHKGECVCTCVCTCMHLLQKETTNTFSTANKLYSWVDLENNRCKYL